MFALRSVLFALPALFVFVFVGVSVSFNFPLSAANETPPLRIYTAERVYGPFTLASEQLQQRPGGIKPVPFEEATWLVGYSAEILDPQGVPLSQDMQCHTMLMKGAATQGSHHRMNSRPFKGIYSDGYTPEIRLPEGFGIYFEGGETVDLIPMFNNRHAKQVSAAVRVQTHFILAAELEQPLTPLYSTIQSVAAPHLYHVAAGKDVRELEFTLPYAGRIHAMGVHIHPYGRSIELIDLEHDQTLWNSVGEVDADGRLIAMPFFSSSMGIPFESGQRFLLRATYDNVTSQEQDAMAGLFMFFSTPDGKPPAIHGAH